MGRAEAHGSDLQFIPDLRKHSWPDPQGVGLWACGFVGFCFVFLEDFFVCFLAMLGAFGALYHRALQGCLGMEAEAGLGGEPGRGD